MGKKNKGNDPLLSLNTTALDAVSVLSAIREELESIRTLAFQTFYGTDVESDGECDTYSEETQAEVDNDWLNRRDIQAVEDSAIALICVDMVDAQKAINSNSALRDAKLFFLNDESYPAHDGMLLWQVYATPEAEQYGPQFVTFSNILKNIVLKPKLQNVKRLI